MDYLHEWAPETLPTDEDGYVLPGYGLLHVGQKTDPAPDDDIVNHHAIIVNVNGQRMMLDITYRQFYPDAPHPLLVPEHDYQLPDGWEII